MAKIPALRRKHSECYQNQWQLEQAISIIKTSIENALIQISAKDSVFSDAYHILGLQYYYQSKFDSALINWNITLEIRKKLYGDEHIIVAGSYNNIGILYWQKDEYDLALNCYFSAFEIYKEKYGKTHKLTAICYNNIGIIYDLKKEHNLALQYYFKSAHIKRTLFGDKDIGLAKSYNNIGIVYEKKQEYDLALQYHFKSLEIDKDQLGEKHTTVATNYFNIGAIYNKKNEYDLALEYYFKSLHLYQELYGEEHTFVGLTYSNLGSVYGSLHRNDLALQYFFQSLQIKRKLLGEKHTDIALSYKNIGGVYERINEIELALKYYQKAIVSSLRKFNDTTNTSTVPYIHDYLSWDGLLNATQAKAQIYAEPKKGYSNIELSLRHYQACDTLINQVRKTITTKSDKIVLGEKASTIYSEAMNVCLKLNNKNLAFKFSEKNKSMVLQSSLAHANALQFAGIPDSLLQQEKTLQKQIAFYAQKLAEQPDSIQEVLFRDKLFTANRAYEMLIAQFETDYKEYFAIKHDDKMVTVQEIQNSLNNNTAVLSYFTADSVIYISTISKTTFDIKPVDKPKNFERQVQMFQKSILTKNNKVYSNYGHKLYKILFPENAIPDNIENLVIIPDGILTTMPFEALLSNKVQTLHATSPQNGYSKYPYLIKDYNISYAYSANLWYQKQNKQPKTYKNDFLAFAPVFADGSTAGTTLRTRSMFAEMDSVAYATDSIATRGRMLNGEQITALPATETEVTEIFNLFEKKRKKAIVKTHAQANEEFAKSDTLTNSRIIHIATHGFVNEEKPELSGILLAQDTTQFEDGILYSGEIYNLNLNAELVVLSACETGLGQIKKGEGVIGLTRALMYAGADNLMVSLWKVSDESTSQLMVDFYTKMLKDKKNKKTYSQLLREAKLEMIENEIYSHPYYWSPFVLIGE